MCTTIAATTDLNPVVATSVGSDLVVYVATQNRAYYGPRDCCAHTPAGLSPVG
jgi:hypothetical protein